VVLPLAVALGDPLPEAVCDPETGLAVDAADTCELLLPVWLPEAELLGAGEDGVGV